MNYELMKSERVKRGYTQKMLADRLQIAQSTYSLYESGKGIPNAEILEKLANIYGISIDCLCGRDIVEIGDRNGKE